MEYRRWIPLRTASNLVQNTALRASNPIANCTVEAVASRAEVDVEHVHRLG
jgi:hypothetical protein